MRRGCRGLLALPAAAALAGLALAAAPATGAGPAPRLTGTSGAVLSISASGPRVAIHARPASSEGKCDHGSVWTPASGSVVRLLDAPCGDNAAQDEYLGLALAGHSAAWTDYDYGNHAYCSGPYAVTLPSGKPRALDSSCDGTTGDEYYDFLAAGDVLLAVSYTVCEADCVGRSGSTLPDGDYGVTVEQVSGTRLVRVLAPRDLRRVLDADTGRVLVLEPGGRLTVYDLHGKALWSTAAGTVGAARISGDTVVASSPGTLRSWSLKGGSPMTRTLPKGAVLRDLLGGTAVYTLKGAVHLLRLAGGADRLVADQNGLVDAQLTSAGLFTAWNVPHAGDHPGRVSFLPVP